jgi:hypothetical protein
MIGVGVEEGLGVKVSVGVGGTVGVGVGDGGWGVAVGKTTAVGSAAVAVEGMAVGAVVGVMRALQALAPHTIRTTSAKADVFGLISLYS